MDRDAPDTGRLRLRLWWLALGVLIVAVVVTFAAGARLGRQHASADPSFGPSAFTAPRWPPTETGVLGDALAAWTTDPAIGAVAGRLVITHAVVDLVAFTPAYVLLAWSVLRWLIRQTGGTRTPGGTVILSLPVVLLAVEVAEGAATLGVLEPWTWDEAPVGPGGLLWIIPLLSTIKWALLLAIAGTVAVLGYVRAVGARS